MIACENSGHSIPDDFPEVRKIVEAGVTTKPQKDYELSRYACYLIVQNGDPRKEVIALGQTYFAIQTYRQEVADHFNELDEDNRRLVVRGDIKQWNQMLAETAHNAGVITNEEFAIFQNAGYMGLYGGLDVDDIHTKKQLELGQKILDYMGSTELIANLFRISQTEEKLRKKLPEGVPVVRISAKENQGLDEFEKVLTDLFFSGKISFNEEVVITSMRHKEALENARDSLLEVKRSLEADMPEDFFSIDLMSAYSSLGEIIGEEVGEDLVNEIFSKFCMGK